MISKVNQYLRGFLLSDAMMNDLTLSEMNPMTTSW